MNKKKILITEDLKKIWIRTTNSTGLWIEVDCFECSNEAFDRWARSHDGIQFVEGNTWEYDRRIAFCQFLWNEGELHMIN